MLLGWPSMKQSKYVQLRICIGRLTPYFISQMYLLQAYCAYKLGCKYLHLQGDVNTVGVSLLVPTNYIGTVWMCTMGMHLL